MDVTYIHTLMNQLFYIHLLYNTGKHCYEKHHEVIFLITEIIRLHFLQSWIIQNWSEEQTRQQCLDKQWEEEVCTILISVIPFWPQIIRLKSVNYRNFVGNTNGRNNRELFLSHFVSVWNWHIRADIAGVCQRSYQPTYHWHLSNFNYAKAK